MLIGHTHRPYIKRKDNRTVINTGGFLPLSDAWAADISEGELRILKTKLVNGRFIFAKELARIGI